MAYGKEEKKGFKTYTCEFPGCGATVSKRKSTVVSGKRICRSHVKSTRITVNLNKGSKKKARQVLRKLERLVS
jgi:hypothetical protein